MRSSAYKIGAIAKWATIVLLVLKAFDIVELSGLIVISPVLIGFTFVVLQAMFDKSTEYKKEKE